MLLKAIWFFTIYHRLESWGRAGVVGGGVQERRRAIRGRKRSKRRFLLKFGNG